MRVKRISKRLWMCLEKVRFDTLFSFKYSPRPHTAAANYPNQVPNEVASRRLMVASE